jgi:glycosyltransferase involved in cell wall biosynthesis
MMEQRGLRILCVVSELLGNRIFGDLMLATLAKLDDVELHAVRLRQEDYQEYPAPRWTRFSASMEATWMLRSKLKKEVHGSFDLIVVTTWVGAIAVKNAARTIPTCASMDQVPANTADVTVLRTRSRLRRLIKRAVWRFDHYAFARAVPHIDVFLPWTTWVRDALVRSYGVSPERCHVTLGPQDLVRWKPRLRVREPRLRLLFVGNDFERKGGELLLRVYAQDLSDFATLTIVTHDPIALERIPAGVKVIHGLARDDLPELFQASDVFVFPTREDMMGLVLAEALAMGLPCIATDLAGIRDLVKDGQTGFLLPYDASDAQWAASVRFLHENRDVLEDLSVAARRFAESRLNALDFERLMRGIVAKLREGKPATLW